MNPIKNKRSYTRDLTYIAFFTALIIISAWIKIPFIIPYTLQSFGIFLAVGLLGGKRATASILLYIFLGAIGLPVFSGFAGGFGVLFGSTGGYIIGFLAPPLVKWALERFLNKCKHLLIFSLIAGLLLCYTFGTAWYICAYTEGFSAEILLSVLSICVFPFILPDFLKLAFAMFLTKKLKKHLQ